MNIVLILCSLNVAMSYFNPPVRLNRATSTSLYHKDCEKNNEADTQDTSNDMLSRMDAILDDTDSTQVTTTGPDLALEQAREPLSKTLSLVIGIGLGFAYFLFSHFSPLSQEVNGAQLLALAEAESPSLQQVTCNKNTQNKPILIDFYAPWYISLSLSLSLSFSLCMCIYYMYLF